MSKRFFPLFLESSIIIMCMVACASKEGNRNPILLSVFSELPIFKDNHERRRLSAEEYISWFSKNKTSLSVSQDTLGFVYSSQFRPSEIDVLDFGYVGQELDSVLNLKNGYCFFLVDLQAKEYSKSQKLRAASQSSYSSFDIKRDFRLILNKDTLPCVLFIPMRESVAVNGHLVYQLGFEHRISNSNGLQGMTLLYDDNLLGSGTREFKFDNDTFGDLPTLKTSVKSKG